MTIRHEDADHYIVPAAPCGKGPHAQCTAPRCEGCLGQGQRLHLDQAQPISVLYDPDPASA